MERLLRESAKGLSVCAEEIESLRSRNEKLSIETNAYRNVLSAVNGHNPIPSNICHSEDIQWKIMKQVADIEQKLKSLELERAASGVK